MASETLSASAIVFCICLPINHKNKRQFNFLPLVKYLYFIFRITPTIDIEPKSKNPSSMRTDFLVGEGGFEPPKSVTTDLQSAPFGHSGILPYVKPTA